MCEDNTNLSKELAPEDVDRGQFVCVLYIIDETIPFCSDGNSPWRRAEPMRYRLLPWRGVRPMRVIDVCLPYVLVKRADGYHQTLDVRQHRLARVSERFGRLAFKRAKADHKKRKGDDDDD